MTVCSLNHQQKDAVNVKSTLSSKLVTEKIGLTNPLNWAWNFF